MNTIHDLIVHINTYWYMMNTWCSSHILKNSVHMFKILRHMFNTSSHDLITWFQEFIYFIFSIYFYELYQTYYHSHFSFVKRFISKVNLFNSYHEIELVVDYFWLIFTYHIKISRNNNQTYKNLNSPSKNVKYRRLLVHWGPNPGPWNHCNITGTEEKWYRGI